MDIRTLIFSLGLLNVALALVVFVYRRTSRNEDPLLRLWLLAKLCCGVGYVLGWGRSTLPPEWASWAHIGNLMQVLGIAVELMVYARLLGALHWVRCIKAAMAVGLPVFAWLILVPESRHPMIVFGTGLAALLYLGMVVLFWLRARQSPDLLRLMSAMNACLAAVLAYKTVVGLLGVNMVPYAVNLMNILVYSVAMWVMCVNGFGFLLLVQQQSDRALQQVLHQLRHSEAEQRELLRMAAHEFRTPAAMVKASVDSLALIDKTLPADVVRRHDNIRLAVQRMTDLAGALITQDRISDGSLEPKRQTVSFDMLVAEAMRQYAPDVPFKLSLNAPMAVVDGDPVLLRIALQNLIDNALVHSPAGEAVEISTSVDHALCCLEVQDHGPGVPLERRVDLFTGRFSGSGSLTKGVGLSIVRGIAQAHGGNVTLVEGPAEGSLFRLMLPLQSARSAAQA